MTTQTFKTSSGNTIVQVIQPIKFNSFIAASGLIPSDHMVCPPGKPVATVPIGFYLVRVSASKLYVKKVNRFSDLKEERT